MKKNKYTVIFLVAILIITGFLFLNEKINEEKTFSNIKNENTNSVKVYVKVFEKNYSIKVEEGATVFDVMKNAQNDGFSFSGKEYPGMGYFVDEINGVKGENGNYWIYSVNGQEADVGVSKYAVKNGDIISWKLK